MRGNLESKKMSALFWGLDYSMSSSSPRTPPLQCARSEFRHISSMSSPIQDRHDNLDRTAREWHMVTATRSLPGSERQGQRESRANLSYPSLPRAPFLQPNRESSAFSPYTKDIWFHGKDAQSIAGSPRNSPKLHQLHEYCDATQSTKIASSSRNQTEFDVHTMPLPFSRTAAFTPSKPQKVKTSLVVTPPLMRAVISQTSPISDQLNEKHFGQQLRERRHTRNEEQRSANRQEPDSKHCGNKESAWSQPSPDLYEDFWSAKDHLSINTHLFPERQPAPHQSAMLSPGCQRARHGRFRLSVDNGIKPCQGEPDEPVPCQPNTNLIQADCGQNCTRHHEDDRNISQVDTNSKNVFGQPRLRASLRAACSPRSVRRSTVLEDLKKLIVMDDTEDGARDHSSLLQQNTVELGASALSSRPATQSYPESPEPGHHSTHPSECCVKPERAESDLWEGDQDHYADLMPLPNTACRLDWDNLVQAARAYETQRMADLLTELSPVSSRSETPTQGTYKIHHSNARYTGEDADDVFIAFPDQLSHLEAMLKRLSSDLLKEKRDKVALLAEVLKLRISNQHLKDESLSAVEQLHKISDILNATPGGIE